MDDLGKFIYGVNILQTVPATTLSPGHGMKWRRQGSDPRRGLDVINWIFPPAEKTSDAILENFMNIHRILIEPDGFSRLEQVKN